MNRSPFVRSLLASAAIAAAVALAGCDTDGNAPTLRSLQPLSPKMVASIEQKNMSSESPILVRVFKEESELEVWKEDKTGRFALLKTYPICRWSGELGPKVKEGDRQAPEGFYAITPSLMNPNSSYYLAINLGFPNAYDKAHGRNGAFLMIHGDCSSRGCYAMTDEQIAEIYALARESFFGGQRAFQIQAYPFRMTPINMAKHRNSPHMAFWKMLKQGNDHFEITRIEPKVDVCEKRYVFDAEQPENSSKPLKFDPAGKCPVFTVNDEVVAALSDKQQRENAEIAQLSRSTPTVAVTTGNDGGMHPTFLAAVNRPRDGRIDGYVRSIAPLPGTIPNNVVPPGPRSPETTGTVAATEVPAPRSAPGRTDSAAPVETASLGSKIGGLFGNLFSSSGETAPKTAEPASEGVLARMSRAIGWRGSDPPETAKPKAAAKQVKTAPAPRAKPQATQQQAENTPSENAGGIRPSAKPQDANAAEPQNNAANAGLLNGAQPPVPSGGFEGRFGAWR